MCDTLGVLESQQRNGMAEQPIHILLEKDSDQFRFREMVSSFENCAEMLSRQTENPVENKGFVKDKISAKLRQVMMSVVLYKQVWWMY